MIVLEITDGAMRHSIECESGTRLTDALQMVHLSVKMPCGGKGTCGKCKVQVSKGNTPPESISLSERKWLDAKEMEENIRLACFFRLEMDTHIVLPQQEAHQILETYTHSDQWDPLLQKCTMEVGTQDGQQDYFEQIKEGLQRQGESAITCPINLLQKLPTLFKNAKDSLDVFYMAQHIVDIQPTQQSQPFYGVAVDIGTTTVVVYLVDGATGTVLDSVCRLNCQKAFGDDVISRIQFTIEKKAGTQVLHEKIIGQLNAMIQHICTEKNISTTQIGCVSICANTVIAHFLLNLPTEDISRAPFTPTFNDLRVMPAVSLGLATHPNGMVVVAPGKSGYVGGDIVAGVAVCGMHERAECCLFLDIGTNGEIVLGNREQLYCCATAAGPAFEGCHIECGTGGVQGAIHRFRFVEGVPMYDTIGNGTPVGICGSGIMDVVAALLKEGIIDETGFMEENYYITDTIYLSQKDIREIQLAKAAVCAGIKTLVKEAGISLEQITTVFLAGGFGNYLNHESALEIGLIPKQLVGKIGSVGNTSGSGAIEMICNKDFLNVLTTVKAQLEYIELSTNPYFMNLYVEEMMFE